MGLSNYPHNKRMQSDTILLAPFAECAADAGRYLACGNSEILNILIRVFHHSP